MADGEKDDRILAEMLALAAQLNATGDALLAGQYDYLRSRVEALIELRSFGAMAAS